MSKKIHFSDDNTYYLLLNIISHDVIHDYGPSGCSKQRWEKNKSLVKQFYSDYYTFSNPLKGGGSDEPIMKRSKGNFGTYSSVTTTSSDRDNSQMDIQPLYPYSNVHGFVPEKRRILKLKQRNLAGIPGSPLSTIFPGIGRSVGTSIDSNTHNYFNYLNAIKEMKEMINTTVIYTFFNHFLRIGTPNINYKFSNYYIVSFDDEVIEPEIFENLCNKFVGACDLHVVNDNLKYQYYLNILCEFLSSYAVEQTIFEYLNFLNVNSYNKNLFDSETGIKRSRGGKNQYGGKEQKLTVDEAKELVAQIDALQNDPSTIQILNELNKLLQIEPDKLSQEEKNNYTSTRKTFLNGFKSILTSFGQSKKAGSIDGDLIYIPPINVRRGRSSGSINLLTSFPEKINALLYDIHQIILEDVKLQQQIEKRRLEDLDAGLKGELTRQDKEVRENFSSFIAKSGLFLTNICDANGNISYSQLTQNSDLRKEINILLYIANWKENPGWQEVRSQDLDTILLEHFKNQYSQYQITEETGQRYVCRTDKYVVNNAANIEKQLKSKSFCPYSSILDGMSLCSWNSSFGEREFGNMDFLITNVNEDFHYNGKLNILEGNEKLQLGFEVKLPKSILTGTKDININGNDLEAHFVLKNTLLNIINFILTLNDNERSQIFTDSNIFNNLFNKFILNTSLFNIVFSEILFKGTGDLFQEINCVCKYGGYTMSNYFCDNNILSFNTSTGDQLRLFTANDRPSGSRFIFMLINGQPTEINLNGVGGYYSEELLFLVKRQELKSICPNQNSRGGKTKKKNKLSKKTRKNHKIRNKIRSKYK